MEAYFARLPVDAALEIYNVCLSAKNNFFSEEINKN
jgi:hypothetical protein